MAIKQSTDGWFDELFAQHVDAIYRFCQAQLGEAAGEDAASEVFVVAWRKADAIPAGAERAWLFGVARRLVANHLRSNRRRRALALKISQSDRGTSDVLDPAVAVAQADLARRAMASLGIRDREVLCLMLAEDLSKAELGQALGVSASAAGVRLSRARARLDQAVANLEATTPRQADFQKVDLS